MFGTPADLLFSGTKRIFPWTIWMDPDSHSPNLMSKTEVKPCPRESIFTAIFKAIMTFYGEIFKLVTGAGMLIAPEVVIPFVAGTDAGERILENGAEAAKVAVVSAGEVIQAVEGVAANTVETASEIAGKVGHLASSVSSFSVPTLPSISSLVSATPKPQTGGGLAKNPLDYLAFGSIFALVAGGILLTANRNFRDANAAAK
jgi:hypothetical protein